jgi:hypothetical protein
MVSLHRVRALPFPKTSDDHLQIPWWTSRLLSKPLATALGESLVFFIAGSACSGKSHEITALADGEIVLGEGLGEQQREPYFLYDIEISTFIFFS